MMDVILEIVERLNLTANICSNLGMVGQNLFVRIRAEIGSCHQIHILSEGESSQVVAVANSIQFGIGLLQAHHGATGKDNLNLGILVVNKLEFLTPIRILENFINQKRSSSLLLKIRHEFAQRVGKEIEMVHVDVKAATIVRAIFFQGILQ